MNLHDLSAVGYIDISGTIFFVIWRFTGSHRYSHQFFAVIVGSWLANVLYTTTDSNHLTASIAPLISCYILEVEQLTAIYDFKCLCQCDKFHYYCKDDIRYWQQKGQLLYEIALKLLVDCKRSICLFLLS